MCLHPSSHSNVILKLTFCFPCRNIRRMDDCFAVPCTIVFVTIVTMAVFSASVMSVVNEHRYKLRPFTKLSFWFTLLTILASRMTVSNYWRALGQKKILKIFFIFGKSSSFEANKKKKFRQVFFFLPGDS